MKLEYRWKKTKTAILKKNNSFYFSKEFKFWENNLIEWDNFEALKLLLHKEKLQWKIDLIYIDPPFATNNIFTIDDDIANSISRTKNWRIAYKDDLREEEFLEFIRERLIILNELLSESGSIYLHIDYKIWHYIKIIMDEVFWQKNYRADITRIKCNPKNFTRKSFWNMKDMVLFYSKSNKATFNDIREPHTKDDIIRLFPRKDENWKHYTTIPLHAPWETLNWETWKEWKGMLPPKGRHWRTSLETLTKWDKEGLIEWSLNWNPRKKVYSDEKKGKKIQDIWTFKDWQKLQYPTQKNIELLKRIIEISSKENDIVLDCFWGSWTTFIASSILNRKWIWIDNSKEAIKVIKNRLEKDKVNYNFIKLDKRK